MILSGKEILKRKDEDIIIEPFNENQINPNSYNLRLHNELMVYENSPLDMKEDNSAKKIIIPEDGLLLESRKLYLGRTIEYTETHNLVPMLEGRSSVGRLGLFVHVTAGFGDVGFKGYWTLEIFCVQPIKIYPSVEICQIFYHSVEGEVDPYKRSVAGWLGEPTGHAGRPSPVLVGARSTPSVRVRSGGPTHSPASSGEVSPRPRARILAPSHYLLWPGAAIPPVRPRAASTGPKRHSPAPYPCA